MYMTGGGEHNTDLKKKDRQYITRKKILSNKDDQGSAAKTSNQYKQCVEILETV